MTNLQIKERIDFNNKMIVELMEPSVFTLNNPVVQLLTENAELQKMCKHSYVDGACEYCYKLEETE